MKKFDLLHYRFRERPPKTVTGDDFFCRKGYSMWTTESAWDISEGCGSIRTTAIPGARPEIKEQCNLSMIL